MVRSSKVHFLLDQLFSLNQNTPDITEVTSCTIITTRGLSCKNHYCTMVYQKSLLYNGVSKTNVVLERHESVHSFVV
jgi:hypothetical protein